MGTVEFNIQIHHKSTMKFLFVFLPAVQENSEKPIQVYADLHPEKRDWKSQLLSMLEQGGEHDMGTYKRIIMDWTRGQRNRHPVRIRNTTSYFLNFMRCIPGCFLNHILTCFYLFCERNSLTGMSYICLQI